jgi:hypothetical protein
MQNVVYTYPEKWETFRFSTSFLAASSTARGDNCRVTAIKGGRKEGETHIKEREQIEDIQVFSRRRTSSTCHVKFK